MCTMAAHLQMNAEGILSMDRLAEQRQRRARGVRMEDFDAGALFL